MSGGYTIDTDAMRLHAGRLDGIGSQLGTAQEAASQVSLNGSDAYGILCSPVLTPLIGAIELAGMAAIGSTQLAVGATAGGIRGMAESYDYAEQLAVDMFDAISDLLGK
ncbi:type VII secretion target [Actinokineospora sp. 24-640]